MQYYIIEFIWKLDSYYAIWQTDENDVFICKNNKVIFWRDLKELRIYFESNYNDLLENEIVTYNLDSIQDWCKATTNDIDCDLILNMWNIFKDAASSTKEQFLGDSEILNSLYDKIFYGNNLKTINSSDKLFTPIFDTQEILNIKQVVQDGVDIIVRQL